MSEPIKPTVERPHAINGEQRIYRFDNGYGASAVRFQFGAAGSYGASEGLWELAVLHFNGPGIDDFTLVYDTPVADDVIGWLGEDGIQEMVSQIRDLPARVAAEVTR